MKDNQLFDLSYVVVWLSLWFAGFCSMLSPLDNYIHFYVITTTIWCTAFLGVTLLGTFDLEQPNRKGVNHDGT